MRKHGAHLRRALYKSSLPTEPVTVPTLTPESDPGPLYTPSLSAYAAVLWRDTAPARVIGLLVGAVGGAAWIGWVGGGASGPPSWLFPSLVPAIPGAIEIAYKIGKAIPPALQQYADSLTQRARLEERSATERPILEVVD
jgi:hypothetical protein